MAENKFIERLQGKGTEKSVVEIKNTATPTMFTNMPAGDSNGFNTYSDHRGNATVVANGTMNWKVDDYSSLVPSSDVHGNGEDLTTWGPVTGAGLWIDAEYTFPSTGDPNHPVAMVFNPQTKWVLKVCGDNLLSPTSNTIDFTVLITFGSSNIISKTFTVAEQANKFCKEFVIDFSESNTNIIKAQGLSTMKLQLLCGTADAAANIYDGMTVLTCLQRKVEAVAISSTFANVEEVLRDGLLPNDYFSNGAYIAQVTDGDTAYAVFQRDGDEMLFIGWHQPIPDQTGNSGKFLMTNGSLMSWEQLTISDVDGLQDDLDDLQNQITTNKNTMDNHIADTNNPHSVTKAQIGLGNCDNTADLDKPISTATQTALDTKATPADITSAISTHNADSSAHSSIISPIQEVIPTAATSSNQLADKNFVNSSIATSTATFRGTYNSLAELEAQTADENDYGFVVSTDAAGNTIYNRYKYTTSTTPASWVFEYALNNSSFTATQWNAINSGANTTNIGQIATNTSAISSHTGNTSNPHQVTKAQVGLSNVDNTSDLNKPISTATQTALNGKQATISDLATIRSNAQAGKAASDTIATYGNIVTHNVSEFATAAQGTKADTALQAGDNVSELVNDAGYLVMGDLTNFVTKNTAQTISGLKTFSADIVLSGTTSIKNTTSGVSYTMLYRDASGIHIGTSTQALLLAGSNARPKFNNNDVAMLADIPTVNNPTITITQGGITKGSFSLNQASGDTIALDAGGGGIGNIDNITITANADDEIQAVGTVNQNTATGATNPIKSWLGDINEYNNQSVPTSNPDALCFIVDKTQTATDRYIVEAQYPDDTNGYTWYFLYSDGWVEQGGKGQVTTNGTGNTFSLPVAMVDTNYTIVVAKWAADTGNVGFNVQPDTTTTFRAGVAYTSALTRYFTWQVSGMAA